MSSEQTDSQNIRVVILDDEALARERLYKLINSLPGYEVVATFSDGTEAQNHMSQINPDIALLDISMPGTGGIEVARYLALMPVPPAVIFCTAHDQFAVEAFDAGAVGYVLKPVRLEKLQKALASAASLNPLQLNKLNDLNADLKSGEADIDSSLIIKSQRQIKRIPLLDIEFFVAEGKYVRVKHKLGEELMEESLLALEEQMQAEMPGQFVRCHRSAVVRLDAVQSLQQSESGGYVLSLGEGQESLPVSRRHLPDVRRLLLGSTD